MPGDGLQVASSRFTHAVTVRRLKTAIADAGLTLFAHIDQAAAARAAGLDLAPLDLLLFGNPRAGTPLLRLAPTIGLDLPLKALAWQDPHGAAWLGFNDPAWIAGRHGLGDGDQDVIEGMARLQAELLAQVASIPSEDGR